MADTRCSFWCEAYEQPKLRIEEVAVAVLHDVLKKRRLKKMEWER